MPGRLLPLGEHAVLLEVDGAHEVLALTGRLRGLPGASDGRLEVVPAARTVMVRATDPADLAAVRAALEGALHDAATGQTTPAPSPSDDPPLSIPVTYDGPDLPDVARLTGLSEDDVVMAHTGTVWTVAFLGFAPGFAYLAGGDPRLHVPRRDTPRTSVPAGAVGLAGEWSGIYPRPSPGGWQLLGRTDVVLWDVCRQPPALLPPGTRVRFEAT